MKSSLLFLLAFCLGSTLVLGQNSNLEFNYAFKIANQTSWQSGRIRNLEGATIGGGNLDLIHVVPSFIWKGKKGFFNEIAIENADFRLSGITNANGTNLNSRSFATHLAVRYGKFYSFFSQKEHKLTPMIGLEVMPFANGFNQSPTKDNYYIFSHRSFGIQAFLTPRLVWHPTKKMFVDLSVQLPLGSLAYGATKATSAGNTPIRDYKTFGFNTSGRGISTNLGIGFKF